MKDFNICIISPEEYPHSFLFKEIADLLMYSLRSIGHNAIVGFNHIDQGNKINIILSIQQYDSNVLGEMPPSTIILNTEALESTADHYRETIMTCCQRGFEVWDYNDVNIEYMHNNGVNNVKRLYFGYQDELRKITPDRKRDIDVLFYGSLNERRQHVVNELINRGLNVKTLFGVYGDERDDWISRSKVVLDHNHYEYNIFNVVRVFYLLTNSVAVISEIHDKTRVEPRFREGVIGSSYENMVDTVMQVLQDEDLLKRQRKIAFNSISQYPQSEIMRALVQ